MKSNHQNKMFLFRRGASLASLSAALAFTSDIAAYAVDEEANDVTFEEIIVSASRRDISLQDTPLAVTSVDPEEFELGGLVALEDILQYAPGVTFKGGQTPGDNNVAIRGVVSLTSAPTTGVYIDDVPVGSSNSFAGGVGQFFDGLQNDVLRVEIVNGPQGTLYGATSMGGLVKYVTRNPATDEFNITAKADLSSTKGGGLNKVFSGRISAPLLEDKLGISVSGFYQKDEGFIDRPATDFDPAGENVNKSKNYGVNAKAVANLTDDFTVTGLYIRNELSTDGKNLLVLDSNFEPTGGRFETETSESNLRAHFELFAGTTKYQFKNNATLTTSTSYESRRSDDSADLVRSFGGLIEVFSGTGPGSITQAPFIGHTATKKFVQEVRLSSGEGNMFDWTIGGIYSKEKSTNGQKLTGMPVNFVVLDIIFPSTVREFAAFGNLTYKVTEKFDVTGGFRYAKVRATVQSTDGPQLLVTTGPEVSAKGTHKTYLLSARYRPTDDMSLYANISSGYRPTQANLPVIGAPTFIESDSLWSYEIGMKGSAADNAFSYSLAAYRVNWTNLQATFFFQGASSAGNLDNGITVTGTEGTLNFRPIEGLDITATASYIHSTLDDDETNVLGAVAGERLPGPRWQASLRGNYTFDITNDYDGFVGAFLGYTGETTTGYQGGTGADGAAIAPIILNVDLPGRIVANANAGVRFGSVTASLYVKNLFNKYALISARADSTGLGNNASGAILQPRTIGATIKVNF